MFSVNEVGEHSVQRSVECVKPLNRAIVVRVAESFADEPTMVENVIGDEGLSVGHVLLFHRTFAVWIDEALMSDEIAGIVEDETTNARSALTDRRKQLLQLFVKVAESEIETHDGHNRIRGAVE